MYISYEREDIGWVAQRDAYLGFYVHWGGGGGAPPAPSSKNIGDGPIKWLLLKKKKKKRTFWSID
jgi:hypothetical protein